MVQKEHRGLSDPEQASILGELIRYLERERSGPLELEDMGRTGSPSARPYLRRPPANDKTPPEIVSRFDALLRIRKLFDWDNSSAQTSPSC